MTAGHEHHWRVVSFERADTLIGYRCRECGEEKFERPIEAPRRATPMEGTS